MPNQTINTVVWWVWSLWYLHLYPDDFIVHIVIVLCCTRTKRSRVYSVPLAGKCPTTPVILLPGWSSFCDTYPDGSVFYIVMVQCCTRTPWSRMCSETESRALKWKMPNHTSDTITLWVWSLCHVILIQQMVQQACNDAVLYWHRHGGPEAQGAIPTIPILGMVPVGFTPSVWDPSSVVYPVVTEKTKITKSRNWTHGPVSLTNLLFFLHKYPKSLILKSVHFFRFWPMFLLKWQQMAGKIAWLPNRVVSFQRKMNCAPQSAVKNAKKGSASETSVSCFFSARLLRARRQNTCLRELQSSLEDTRSAWQRLRLSWSQGNKTSQYFHSRKGKTTCK